MNSSPGVAYCPRGTPWPWKHSKGALILPDLSWKTPRGMWLSCGDLVTGTASVRKRMYKGQTAPTPLFVDGGRGGRGGAERMGKPGKSVKSDSETHREHGRHVTRSDQQRAKQWADLGLQPPFLRPCQQPLPFLPPEPGQLPPASTTATTAI